MIIVHEKLNVANKNFFRRVDDDIEIVCETSGGRSESQVRHLSTEKLKNINNLSYKCANILEQHREPNYKKWSNECAKN